jgi:hypothetical protein
MATPEEGIPSIDEAILITPEDIARAKTGWKKDAPEEYRNLLDATPIPDRDDAES